MTKGLGKREIDSERTLYLVYNYRYQRRWGESIAKENMSLKDFGPSYFILYSFVGGRALDSFYLHNLYRKHHPEAEKPSIFPVGPFEGGEELHEFVRKILRELQIPSCLMLSVQEYNMGLETIHDIKDFFALFEGFGKKLTNPEFSTRSRLLDRLFGEF